MNIVTKIVSPFFATRQREIEQFGKQLADIQHRQLRYLLTTAQHTEWGELYSYKDIREYRTFAERVPVSSYEDLVPFIDRMVRGEKNILWPSDVRWFAKSSGTTNDRSKYIPVTSEILHKCHYQGGFDSAALYLNQNPQSRFFSKKNLILGGSYSPSTISNSVLTNNTTSMQGDTTHRVKTKCGDLSAVLLKNLNPFVNFVRVPRKEIILMNEWEAKMKAIVETTWKKDVASLSGIPSWMLTLIKAVMQKAGKETLTEVWPNLEVFFHGGVGFEPYRAQYEKLIPSTKMHYMETYNASEGFFGIQDDLSVKSMLLMPDYQIFYEFISMNEAENEKVIPLDEVKTGENYAMVISTSGGLWRYKIGDTVRFTSLFPHKFIITGRTKFFINAFGEELMVDNAEKGIRAACKETNASVIAYTAAPLFLLDKGKGQHQWLIEFDSQPTALEHFTACLDKTLQQVNSDYEAKRYKEIALQMPEIIVARKNLFFDWMKKHNKLGGQHKVPNLSNNRDIINELLSMNN